MFVYNCKVRLAGSLLNEVRKDGVTAPEIMLFQAFHGPDAVVDIVEVGPISRDDDTERDRLTNIYMGAIDAERGKEKQAIWMNLFGHAGNPLPTRLKGEYPKLPPEKKGKVDPRSKREIMRGEPAPEPESVLE